MVNQGYQPTRIGTQPNSNATRGQGIIPPPRGGTGEVARGLILTVKMRDLDLVKQMIGLLSKMILDDRIDIKTRDEYRAEVNKLINEIQAANG